jgi:hypothetical protein
MKAPVTPQINESFLGGNRPPPNQTMIIDTSTSGGNRPIPKKADFSKLSKEPQWLFLEDDDDKKL